MSHVWLSYQGYAVHTDLTLDRPTRVVTKSPCIAPGGDVEAYVASDDVGAMCPHLEVYQCRVVVSVLCYYKLVRVSSCRHCNLHVSVFQLLMHLRRSCFCACPRARCQIQTWRLLQSQHALVPARV